MRWALAALLLASGCSLADSERGAGGEGPPGPDDDGGGVDRDEATGALPATGETPAYREADPSDLSAGGGAPGCFEPDVQPAFYECDATMLASCGDLRSCCVGDADCCSDVLGGALPDGELSFDCAPGRAEPCLAAAGVAVSAFGFPEPRIEDGALLPNGEGRDSGLVMGRPVDLTAHRVTLSATFGAPSDCGATCLEGVAVGFTRAEDLDGTSNVRMLVGLLYSGSRNDVSLMVGGEAVARWQLAGTAERWSMVVRPDGRVVVDGDGSVAGDETHHGEAEIGPADGARLVVYGRNMNRPADAPLGARLTSLSVSTALCDMPAAWPERAEVSLVASGSPWEPGAVRAPTIAYDDGERALVAFEHDGNIVVARRQDEGATGTLEVQGSPDVSVVTAPAGATLRDPELVWRAGGWTLFYTVDLGAEAAIGRADADATGTTFTTVSDAVVDFDDLSRVEQPTVELHYTGVWIMVARTTDLSGVSRLSIFRSVDGSSWARDSRGHLEALTARSGEAGTGLDADEIAHPSLVIHDGAWHVYYAGRRGTRWGIGLIVSDELLRWRSLGQVLGPDGNGFDRIGVGAPDAFSSGDSVELLYEGGDGAGTSIGRAWRRATPLGYR